MTVRMRYKHLDRLKRSSMHDWHMTQFEYDNDMLMVHLFKNPDRKIADDVFILIPMSMTEFRLWNVRLQMYTNGRISEEGRREIFKELVHLYEVSLVDEMI